jgi:hypothetical protein
MNSDVYAEQFFKFSAYGAEAVYGFGTRIQAIEWMESANADRKANCYEMEVVEPSEDQEAMAFSLDEWAEEVNA